MVTYNSCDVIELQDFAFVWRITDPRWDNLPAEVLDRFFPLSTQRSTELFERSKVYHSGLNWGVFGNYQIKENVSLVDNGPSDEEHIKSWLQSLPIPPSERVYVCWRGSTALITEWNLFIQIWDSLWYPFDIVDVFDETLNWALTFGPEETALYIERTP